LTGLQGEEPNRRLVIRERGLDPSRPLYSPPWAYRARWRSDGLRQTCAVSHRRYARFAVSSNVHRVTEVDVSWRGHRVEVAHADAGGERAIGDG
jgi:hypothetical protein